MPRKGRKTYLPLGRREVTLMEFRSSIDGQSPTRRDAEVRKCYVFGMAWSSQGAMKRQLEAVPRA